MSIVWHTRQPWLPKAFQVCPLHQSIKGRKDFENKGLEDLGQCQDPHDFYVEPIQKKCCKGTIHYC
jgi:hypothetical protein